MELDLVDGCDDPNRPLDPLVTRKSLVDMIYMTGMLIGRLQTISFSYDNTITNSTCFSSFL